MGTPWLGTSTILVVGHLFSPRWHQKSKFICMGAGLETIAHLIGDELVTDELMNGTGSIKWKDTDGFT